MTEWIRRFRKNIHSPADLALLFRLGTWLALEPFLIRFLSLPRLLAWHTPARPLLPSHRRARLRIFTQFLLSDRVDLFERTCLKRSLLLYRYLHGEPNPPRFHLGVRSKNGRLQGHSWVTLGGAPLDPGEDQGYAVTFAYPPAEDKQ
jgi:hypothetical protein